VPRSRVRDCSSISSVVRSALGEIGCSRGPGVRRRRHDSGTASAARASIGVVGTALALLGVLLVLFVAAVLSTREGQVMASAPQDLPDLRLPDGPLRPQDVEAVRFSTAPRGYRMSEVDAVLDRLAAELADRDRRLGLLEEAARRPTQNVAEPPRSA
jgi:DivIVA domain-containing protein